MKWHLPQPLAIHGQEGFAMYRVPGAVTASNGDLLVTYEGRKENDAERTLLWRRSCDGGATFAPQQVLRTAPPGVTVHNPLLIPGEKGTLFFFWNEDYRRLFLQISRDDGKTFGPVQDLTAVVEEFRAEYAWNAFAVAPGHGLRMHNGTLVLPLWMSSGVNAHQPACFATLSSTDEGKSWQRSNRIESSGAILDPTEGSIAERRDGTLLATMRHGGGLSRLRAFAVGTPTGWRPAFLDVNLPDPICAGALLSLPDGRMLFSNCAYGDEPALAALRLGTPIRWSLDARQNLTLRVSTDEGRTWSAGLSLEQEAGYSDLAASPDGNWIYCFYERGWLGGNCIFNRELAFLRIPITALR